MGLITTISVVLVQSAENIFCLFVIAGFETQRVLVPNDCVQSITADVQDKRIGSGLRRSPKNCFDNLDACRTISKVNVYFLVVES